MKLRDKRTGEIRIVNGSYADRTKGTVRIYLADLNKRPVGDAMLPDIIKNYEVVEKPKTVYDLKDGDECWTVFCAELGYVSVRIKFNGLAMMLRETGSLYLTKEEAEKDIAWNRAREILIRDTKGFKPSRSDDYRHIEVYYTDEGDLDTASDHGLDGCIYFESYADAEASIDAHPNEWRTYLGVEG